MSKDDPFVVPQHLLMRPLPQHNNNPLNSVAELHDVRHFGEITIDLLRNLYEQQTSESRRFFWRVVTQLSFFGAIFRSPRLASINILSDWRDSLYLWLPSSLHSEPMQWEGAWSAGAKASGQGLVLKGNALGVPLKSIELLEPEASLEEVLRKGGFELVNIDQITAWTSPEQDAPQPKPFLPDVEREGRLRVAGQEFVLPARVRDVRITAEDMPNCPALAKKLEQKGYSTWGSLPYALDDFLLEIKGVGKTHLKKLAVALAFVGANLSENTSSKLGVSTKPTYWRGVTLSSLQKIPVSANVFFECPRIAEQLRSHGIDTLAILSRTSDVSAFLRSFDEVVEPAEVKRFSQFLDELVETLRVPGTASILCFSGERLVLPESVAQLPLSVLLRGDLGAPSIVLERLRGAGYRSVADLPISLSAVVEKSSDVVPEDLPVLFSFIKTLVDLAALHHHLSGKRLGSYMLDSLVEYANFLALGNEPADVRKPRSWERGWDLFHRKLDYLQRGEYLTLEQMGVILGVTRERARQIQQDTLKVLAEPYRKTITDLRILIQEPGHQFTPLDFYVSEPVDDLRTRLVLEFLLDVHSKIDLDQQYGLLSTFTTSERQQILERLKDRIGGEYEGQIFAEEDLARMLGEFVEAEELSAGAKAPLSRYAKSTFLTVLPDGGLGLRLTKDRLALHVFKEYSQEHPEGVALYRDAGILRARLDRIKPDVFSNDHNFIVALLRNEDVVLWGRGKYTHRDLISATSSDIRPVVEWIQNQLQRGVPHLSSRAAFLTFQDNLQVIGVPNDYALYSCLRLFFAESFFQPHYPKIFPLWRKKNFSNSEMVEEHLERYGDQTYENLRREFVDDRGWHSYQLAQTIIWANSVTRTDQGTYGLLQKHMVPRACMVSLADYVESRFTEDLQTISVRLLFKERKATCLQLGIGNEHLLYSLLVEYFADRFLFPQFPHVVKQSHAAGAEISNRALVEQLVLEAGGPILKEELQHELVDRRGWTDRELNNALVYQKNVLPIQRGVVPEYVHRDIIGWGQDKQEHFEAWVQEIAEGVDGRDFPFGNVRRDLLDQSRLPKLDNGLHWTEDLLKAKLEDIETVVLLGTKHSVFAAYPNAAGVEDDNDFVAYVLEAEFGGAAKTRVLQRRLSDLEFRVQQLKQPSNGKGSELPYYIVGDEILLKEG